MATTPSRRSRRMVASDAPVIAEWLRVDLPLPLALSTALADLIASLLDTGSLLGECVEDYDTARSEWRKVAGGLSGFIGEDCVAELLERPQPWVALRLLERARTGASLPGFMTYEQVARANAEASLTLLPFVWVQRPSGPETAEGRELLMLGQQSLMRSHRGYRLRRLLKEAPAAIEAMFVAAGLKRLRFIAASPTQQLSALDAGEDRVLLGITREEVEASQPGPPIFWLFTNKRPRCGFTRAEQQVMLLAADGLTDAEIAEKLSISLNSAKKRWGSIYKRAQQHFPSLLNVMEPTEADARGKEKRRPVLALLQDHPEELRPFAFR